MTKKSNVISKTIVKVAGTQKYEETIYNVTCRICNKPIELFTIGKVSNSAQMLKARSHISKHFLEPQTDLERFMKVETA